MDVRYVEPFLEPTKNVLKTMVGTEVRVGQPRRASGLAQHFDVSGIVGLSGDAVVLQRWITLLLRAATVKEQ